jgi:hypothetical protein
LKICGITKHQYYYLSKKTKQGLNTSLSTQYIKSGASINQECAIIDVLNSEVVKEVKLIHQDPDMDYGYHKMTSSYLTKCMEKRSSQLKLRQKHNQL